MVASLVALKNVSSGVRGASSLALISVRRFVACGAAELRKRRLEPAPALLVERGEAGRPRPLRLLIRLGEEQVDVVRDTRVPGARRMIVGRDDRLGDGVDRRVLRRRQEGERRRGFGRLNRGKRLRSVVRKIRPDGDRAGRSPQRTEAPIRRETASNILSAPLHVHKSTGCPLRDDLDRLGQRHAATPLAEGDSGCAAAVERLDEVLDHTAMRAGVSHDRRGRRRPRLRAFGAPAGFGPVGASPLDVTKTRHHPFCSMTRYRPIRPARPGGCSPATPRSCTRASPPRRWRTEHGDDGVLDFDGMQRRDRFRVNTTHIAEQPQQQIGRVDPLVHQRAAAVERPCAAPARLRWSSGRRYHLTRASASVTRPRTPASISRFSATKSGVARS